MYTVVSNSGGGVAPSACPDRSGRWSTCVICLHASLCHGVSWVTLQSHVSLVFIIWVGQLPFVPDWRRSWTCAGLKFCCIKSTALWTASDAIVSSKEAMGEQMMWDGAITQFSQVHLTPLMLRGCIPATLKAGLSASLQLDPVWCGSSTTARDHRACHTAWAHTPESIDCWGRWPNDVS